MTKKASGSKSKLWRLACSCGFPSRSAERDLKKEPGPGEPREAYGTSATRLWHPHLAALPHWPRLAPFSPWPCVTNRPLLLVPLLLAFLSLAKNGTLAKTHTESDLSCFGVPRRFWAKKPYPQPNFCVSTSVRLPSLRSGAVGGSCGAAAGPRDGELGAERGHGELGS